MTQFNPLKTLFLCLFMVIGWNVQAQDPCPDCDFSPFEPVCVVEQGDTITLPNFCFVECLGLDSSDLVTCNITLPPDPCNCFFSFEPVCVNDATTGETLYFLNECYAECEGYTSSDFVVCDSLPANCEAYFEYVPDWNNSLTAQFLSFSLGATAWSWDFGDGNTSMDENPNHTYASEGIYNVTLTIQGDSCTSTYTMPISVDNGNIGGSDCHAFFFTSMASSNPLEVAFLNLSTASGMNGITSWSWDFGDGNTSTDPNPTHTYADEGTYTATLTITADSTCTDSYEATFYVGGLNFGCLASFSYEQPDPAVNTIEFTDESIAFNGTITSWAWNFGDGNISSDPNPIHTYADEGDYTVSLIINTDDGCANIIDIYIHVGVYNTYPWVPDDCQAFFNFSQDSNDEMTINFEDISFTNEPITEWFWNFGDGNVSSEQNPSHTYTDGGIYPVTLTIATDSCQSNFIMLVFAGDDAWYPTDCQALFLPIMDGTTVFLLGLPFSDSEIIEWAWDFGDGNTSNEPFPVHTYADAGDYSITLTITTADGCTSSFTIGVDLLDGFISGNATQDYMLTGTTSNENISIVDKVKSYPNPATDMFNLELSTSSDKEVQVNVKTVNGIQISGNTHQLYTGENKIQLDVARLTSGVYFVEIVEGNQVKTIKFIK